MGMDTVQQESLAYLAAHQVMTLATTGPKGVWAAAVFYVNVGFDFYFLSAGHTRHAQNLAVQPRTAVTIHEDYTDWQIIQGIQLEGLVRQLTGAEKETAVIQYKAKYPFLTTAPTPVRQALLKVNWYHLKPDLAYFIDNSKGFGHRDEIPLP